MRAIALLLLGLIALAAARPGCAASPAPTAMHHAGGTAHQGCPPSHGREVHVCAAAACVGCTLGAARIAVPFVAPTFVAMAPAVVPVARLDGGGPAAAIPPPRPIA